MLPPLECLKRVSEVSFDQELIYTKQSSLECYALGHILAGSYVGNINPFCRVEQTVYSSLGSGADSVQRYCTVL